jgi:hypothetical protein
VEDPSQRTIVVVREGFVATSFLGTLFGKGPKLWCTQIEVPPRGAD